MTTATKPATTAATEEHACWTARRGDVMQRECSCGWVSVRLHATQDPERKTEAGALLIQLGRWHRDGLDLY